MMIVMSSIFIILTCMAFNWYRRPMKSPWKTIWPERWLAGRRRQWPRIIKRVMNVNYMIVCKPPNHSGLSLVSNRIISYYIVFMKSLSILYSIIEWLRDIIHEQFCLLGLVLQMAKIHGIEYLCMMRENQILFLGSNRINMKVLSIYYQ